MADLPERYAGLGKEHARHFKRKSSSRTSRRRSLSSPTDQNTATSQKGWRRQRSRPAFTHLRVELLIHTSC